MTKERPGQICVDYIEGPLKYLQNEWRFEPAPGRHQRRFLGRFRLQVADLRKALPGQMFDRALRRMTGAFEKRAEQLYGISSSSAQSAA